MTEPTSITLQQFIEQLLALPESTRSLPVAWRSPSTGTCYEIESTVRIAVQTLRHREGRGSKATVIEKDCVVIE